MYTAVNEQLAESLAITRRMLDLVKAGEWEQVAELARQRHRLLRQGVVATDPAMVQQQIGMLQEIRQLDQEIELLSRRGRDEVETRLRQIHQGRKAGKAYKG
ncbi:MAG: flagellar protein FliT [Candidatus Thiodiazotropha sp. (ex Epidulcina cf. delphinae)]|nr:flagellar protein FliT [Candidatus Thiodiazotropha sp. (ex Epidulcina cf. delphinae)]